MMLRTLFVGLIAFAALAGPAAAQSFNAQEQAEIRAVVRDYLVRNPDVLREALDALQARVDAERRVRIETDTRDFSIGPADAPITVVEFFDYRCPYCHAANEWVNDLIRTRRDVRVVFKELPILSQESVLASRAAIASIPQGRYLQFHSALMAFRGELDSARIDALARQAGVDVPRMRRAMNETAIDTLINDNRALAIDTVNSDSAPTPIFMINGAVVRGFRQEELAQRLREATREARRGGRS
jgi:protein-disulfide isomerase